MLNLNPTSIPPTVFPIQFVVLLHTLHCKGRVREIRPDLFFSLKENTSETRKFISFHFKSSFRFQENQFLEF